MVKYENACVYKICCKDPDIKDVYIGSTCNLIRRRACHKKCCNNENNEKYNLKVYKFIRDHGGWDNWIVLKIKDTPVDNVDELRLREREEFEKIGATLNMCYPQRSYKEYYEENREHIIQKKKEYNNLQEVKQRHREYYQENKQEIRHKKKEYYQENKQEINEKRREKVACEICGSVVTKIHLTRHKNSKKCKKHLLEH